MALQDVSPSRTLRVDGLVNARDLGGLRRRDGTSTPRGVFYRSENVARVTPAGWEQVHAEGICTVVDLRQPREREADTHRLPSWLNTVELDLDGLDNAEFWKDYLENGLAGTALYFLPYLEVMSERAGAALAAIIGAPPGGVLYHCVGGRDRTGLVAMLLLSAAETDPDEIVDDYLETVRLGDVRAASTNRNNAEPAMEAVCREHGTTTEGAFRAALAGLDLIRLLPKMGLDEDERRSLSTWRGALAPHR
jgi:protein-tyrosine phosphatase